MIYFIVKTEQLETKTRVSITTSLLYSFVTSARSYCDPSGLLRGNLCMLCFVMRKPACWIWFFELYCTVRFVNDCNKGAVVVVGKFVRSFISYYYS